MKAIAFLTLFILAGCCTPIPTPPNVGPELMEKPAPLKTITTVKAEVK